MSNPYEPQVHFLPETGWMNDPNGLVYFQNTWHLFYQYYEPSQVDGLQWGHATSDDLLHWQHLPPAIIPDELGDIYSGSAVVDHNDTSGFFGGDAGMVCIFTYNKKEEGGRQSQGIAYSKDGINFTVYDGNPVIPQLRYLDGHPDDRHFRDPKVFWHEPTQKWIMIVAGGTVRFFSSSNLIDWEFESINEDIQTECPDLFELAVDDDPANTTWLLSLCGRGYILGDFDGKHFTPTSERIPMTFGPDYYASQSWSDAPDGRRIMITWLFTWHYDTSPHEGGIRNAFPTGHQVGSCMSLPYELGLRSTADGPRLVQLPIDESQVLQKEIASSEQLEVNDVQEIENTGRSFNLAFNIDTCLSDTFELSLKTNNEGTISCGYDSVKKTVFIDRSACGFESVSHFAKCFESEPLGDNDNLDLLIVVDSCSIELFAQNGLVHLSTFALIEEVPQAALHGSATLKNYRLSLNALLVVQA